MWSIPITSTSSLIIVLKSGTTRHLSMIDEKISELCADTIEYLDKMKNDLDTMIKIASKDDDYITLALKQCVS